MRSSLAALLLLNGATAFRGTMRPISGPSTSISEQSVTDLNLDQMQEMFTAASLDLPGSEGPELKKFDPLRFAEKSPNWLPWFRESELKHSRIAMLATLGIIAADFYRLPGEVFQAGSVIEAHNNMVESGAMIQILLWVSLLEIITTPVTLALFNSASDRKPGNFGFDPLGLGKDPARFKVYEVNELKNGRLAMLAFSGIITTAVLNDKGFPYF